jgi:alpha-tubulin suppressor-like RCC1 family protein
VGTDADWVTVAGGLYHMVALKADGSLWAWGYNYYGQLGLGDSGSGTNRSVPARVGAANDWVSVRAGIEHSVALKADGSLWAWGYNQYGQLGLGDNTDRNVPTRVGADSDWAAVAARADSTTLALRGGGSRWAGGHNSAGQLGQGDNTNRNVPTRVGADNDWAAVGGGGAHVLAVKSDGSLWAWGRNANGQLGLGDATDRNVPTRVGADSDWAAVAVGASHSLARKTSGDFWVWGYNAQGQPGLGDWADRNVPISLGTDNVWTAVAPGNTHMLALRADGSLWVWGRNDSGQLGLGDSGSGTDRNVPTRGGAASDWAAAAGGRFHSLSHKADGYIWAWGRNNQSQLGLGDATNRDIPTLVGDGWRVPAK